VSQRRPVAGIPANAVEVRRKETEEVVGWLWHEEVSTAVREHGHWRFAVAMDADPTQAYVSPYGFLERRYALARVAVIKGIVSHHLYVAGD
jgi:hypothetical protein